MEATPAVTNYPSDKTVQAIIIGLVMGALRDLGIQYDQVKPRLRSEDDGEDYYFWWEIRARRFNGRFLGFLWRTRENVLKIAYEGAFCTPGTFLLTVSAGSAVNSEQMKKISEALSGVFHHEDGTVTTLKVTSLAKY